MNRQEIINRYQKDEDQYLIAKVLDKIEFVKTRNRIEHTDFLDEHQKNMVEKIMKKVKTQNYHFFGGIEQSERMMLILYPEKLKEVIQEEKFDYGTIIKVIKITLPNELKGMYTHKEYLSGLMKLGIKREKIGDILVSKEDAIILVCEDILKYVWMNLPQLTRFQKSKIEEITIDKIKPVEKEMEEIHIIVSSLRLDAIVAELASTSRGKANDMIMKERIFVNSEQEIRNSKEIKVQDKITIRGKGRFYINEIQGETKKGKVILKVLHNI